MTRDDDDLLSAEYVLGTLDPEARKQLEFRLLDDASLQETVCAWQERLHPLDNSSPLEEPPAGLWNKIEALIEDPTPAFVTTIRTDEGEWLPLAEGIEKKSLFVDRDLACESFLLRFAPGAALYAHSHSMAEECLLLDGDMAIGDLRLAAGDFHVISAGTEHPVITSTAGALVYVRGEIREATA